MSAIDFKCCAKIAKSNGLTLVKDENSIDVEEFGVCIYGCGNNDRDIGDLHSYLTGYEMGASRTSRKGKKK